MYCASHHASTEIAWIEIFANGTRAGTTNLAIMERMAHVIGTTSAALQATASLTIEHSMALDLSKVIEVSWELSLGGVIGMRWVADFASTTAQSCS